MRPIRPPTKLVLLVLAAAAAGCGGDSAVEPAVREPAGTAAETGRTASPLPPPTVVTADLAAAKRPAGEEGLRVPATAARIVARSSEFGRVLFDANGQVVYVFENDRRDRSNCTTADCVTAWPPVLTREDPTAGPGVQSRLLGTIRRSDGSRQVTYDGRPLYFYEHEAPGEIRCHDVHLHGGLWWVVTPTGEPAA